MTDISPLLEIMARLRDPERGCPWDVEQDFSSIAPYTIEEAYEVVDAIDRGDMDDLKDELGDLLLQVVFHARMAEEAGHFVFAEVLAAICDKMVRRHPHVFDAQGRASAAGGRMPGAAGGVMVENAEHQTRLWEEGKRREREAKTDDRSVLAGIARGLPEWQRALKLQKRAARVGFDWPGPAPVFEKLHEEVEELRAEFAAVAANPEDAAAKARLQAELGDVLFVCANLARHAGVDPGAALRGTNLKFEQRFRRMEALAEAQGGLDGLDLAQQDALWDQVKREERERRGNAEAT